MAKQEKTFTISVEINRGLEPLTFTVISEDAPALSGDGLQFKVFQDQQVLAILVSEGAAGWKQIQGEMTQEQVQLIGAAISKQLA